MKILVMGDVIGKPGREAVKETLPRLRDEYGITLAIANGENAAGGIGLTPGTAQELFDSGIDVITTGNHVWAHHEVIPYLDSAAAVIRPLNYPPVTPGRGYWIKDNIMVVNIIGRTFVGDFDCPFRAMDKLLGELDRKPAVIIVDFHAEATSEKVAMGRYLDGRVSAVLGTHTHIGTIDACILPKGTAYVTEIGMVGPINSVIGVEVSAVIDRFLTQIPKRFSVAKGQVSFDAIVVEATDNSGKAIDIKRVRQVVD
ncbi:MAG: TIGR00282 family metallophosphoesterase [Dehalococcoidales bacterium]|nr:TIGR00282 family metallophosphoesterase [Dehalococcoidales bacterium]